MASPSLVVSSSLFRKYLPNCCQEDFERRWVTEEATAGAAAMKASEDQATNAATKQNKDEEQALYSEVRCVEGKASGY